MSGERAVDVEDWTACAEGFLEEDETLRAAGVVAEREPDRGIDREGRVPSRSDNMTTFRELEREEGDQ